MTSHFTFPDLSQDRRPHAIVIGAGLGGLAAAARLAAKGYRITVLEKLDGPGGRAYTFRQDGFTFDAGPTIVTAPYIFEELWAACGGRLADDVDLRPNNPFYKIRFNDGEVFNYSADREAMRAEVARFCPEDVAGFDRFMERSREIYSVAFEQLADKPFHSLLFTAKTMADLVRLGGYWPVYTTVSRYFRDPRLRIVFSFHPLLIGGNPLSTTSYYCLIAHLESKYGVHYAMGGTGAIVRGIAGLIERQGGIIRYGSEVSQILTQGRRATGVKLSTGETIDCDLVVSNADPAWTYGWLLSRHRRRRWTDRKIARSAYSMSLFVWYFGTNRRYEDVYHHTIMLGPRYEGLLKDIFTRHRLAEDFSLYLHRPTASDPSLAPEGCDAFYVLSPVPNLRSGTDWASQAEPYREAIERHLEATLLPGLSQSVVTSRLMTPVDFRDRLLSHEGAAFALEPKLLQSAWFRPHNRSEELDNLYLVGAGTHPGAGMPGVVTSAKLVADLIPDAQSATAKSGA
jgi:phytoene desaturase